jgi:hypothetical protein
MDAPVCIFTRLAPRHSGRAFGIVKGLRSRYWIVLVPAFAIGLVLVWEQAHRPKPSAREWILLSTPTVGSRTNFGAATPIVTFRVSNVGPRLVDFQVWWFECRTKRDGFLLATNRLKHVSTPLAPGQSTSLTMDVSLAAPPVEDCLCCYQVQWFQRGAPVRGAVDSAASWWFDLFGLDWKSPWLPERLMQGKTFAANLEVAEYFRQMYGFTRAQWLEDLARMQTARTEPGQALRYGLRTPTADETITNDAREAFVEFCQASTSLARDAEPIASPNATAPHR